ncbi:MAG: inorganic phosphate transporter [Phycisphaerae bacterium]|nr:inorganic phosphate transporter [Phycisphaerae bacterium]
MLTLALITLILTIAFAILFDMTNGWNDAANAIATVVSTRVLKPYHAVVFGAVLNFCGALVASKVASTVGSKLAQPEFLTGATFLAAVMTAPFWITFCSRRGLPNSCSHALLGALIGAVVASAGSFHGLKWAYIGMVFFGVLICPIAGFLLGNLLVRIITALFKHATPAKATFLFGKLQLLSAGAMAFAHGTGDAQKAMGIISGALVAYAWQAHGQRIPFHIPFWVRLTAAAAMAVGTSLGGWRVMRTLGSRLAHLRTYQGFAAETAAATTIMMNTFWGIPISTTHSITGAILGVGAERGMKMVRWGVGKKIVFAWIVTFPVCIIAGAIVVRLLHLVGIH